MTQALDYLRKALAEQNAGALRASVAPPPKTLEPEIARLQAWLNSAGGTKAPARNRLLEAMARFHQALRFSGFYHARLVCFGCTEALGQGNYRLVEDDQRFPVMLERVDEYRREPRLYRRCYRALLSGYFSYDPHQAETPPVGRKNWTMLRTYLADRLTGIQVPGFVPQWAKAIEAHPNLFASDPCARYGLEVLKGNGEVFRELKDQLEISDASWLIQSLVLAQVEAATQQEDAPYTSLVPAVLDLLERHRFLLGEGLARLLSRHHRCRPVAEHTQLRDFSVREWGNPWLALNAARWGRVDEPVRRMVGGWLNHDIIKGFFTVLAADGAMDTRRLKFWQRYADHIDDMYFALGPSASTNRNPDYRTLRQKMTGRLLRLQRSGSPQNNAFVMMAGRYVIVEFGLTGNACFIFKGDALPFSLKREVAGDATGLKDASYLHRMRHVDTRMGKWERAFAAVLDRQLGIRPDAAHLSATTGSAPALARERYFQPDPPRPPVPPEERKSFSMRALEDFTAAHGLGFSDRRERGGGLWVHGKNLSAAVKAQLEAWGFLYSERRGEWWKRD